MQNDSLPRPTMVDPVTPMSIARAKAAAAVERAEVAAVLGQAELRTRSSVMSRDELLLLLADLLARSGRDVQLTLALVDRWGAETILQEFDALMGDR